MRKEHVLHEEILTEKYDHDRKELKGEVRLTLRDDLFHVEKNTYLPQSSSGEIRFFIIDDKTSIKSSRTKLMRNVVFILFQNFQVASKKVLKSVKFNLIPIDTINF